MRSFDGAPNYLGAMEGRMTAAGRAIHFEHSVLSYLDIISASSSSKDRIGKRGLIDAVFDEGLVDVNRDDLAENKPSLDRLALPVLELNHLGNLAFHRRSAFAHPRDADMAAGRRRQSCALEFTYTVCQRGRRGVHLFAQFPGHEVPDELTRFQHVLDAVFPRNGCKSQDRRVIVERIKEAVRRKVELPLCVSGGNPADGAWRNDRVERVMSKSMPLGWLVVVHVFGIHAETPPR